MLKVIIFDIDGVLFDASKANYLYYSKIFSSFGIKPPSYSKYLKTLYLTTKQNLQYHSGIKDKTKLKKLFEISQNTPYPKSAAKIPENSKKILRQLKNHFKLAIATNRTKRGVLAYLQKSNNQHLFDYIVTAEDVKKPKPNSEALVKILKKFKINPNQTVYIGDTKVDYIASSIAKIPFIQFTEFTKEKKYTPLIASNFKNLLNIILNVQKSKIT